MVQILNNGDTISLQREKINLIAQDVISTYIHTLSNTTHTLIGSGSNGKFKATASGTVSAFTIGGTSYSVVQGEDSEIELVSGCWYTFILDGTTINFKQGGTALNFKIVGGTTQPTSPKENTIWVNTDVAIGDWQFISTQPTTRSDGTPLQNGDLWITSGNIYSLSLNALKKNNITIYPIFCYQYANSKYVEKDFLLYQEGEWKTAGTMLYFKGNEYIGMTGGWTSDLYSSTAEKGGASKGATQMDIWSATTQGGTNYSQYRTVRPIDFRPYSQLNLAVSKSNGGTVLVMIGETGVYTTTINGEQNIKIDLSAYKVSSALVIRITSAWNGVGAGGNLSIKSINLR